jgi:RHS repeat-associated protein
MKKLASFITILLCLVGLEAFAQTRIQVYNAALPIETCVQSGTTKRFTYSNPNYTYNWIVWSVASGTVVSTSGTANSNADIIFNAGSGGYINIELHNGGEPDASNLVASFTSIPVYTSSVGTLTTPNNTVCYGTTMAVSCSGCQGTINWATRQVGTSTWTSQGTTSNAGAKSLTFNFDTEVRATAGACSTTPSATKTVYVWGVPNGGVIETASYTICSGTSPGALGGAGTTGSLPSNNPSGGTLTYQWQQKSGSAWVDISGATSVTWTPSSLTTTFTDTYTYRRKTTSCASGSPSVAYSNELNITIYSVSAGGTLTTPTSTVCGSGTVRLNLANPTGTLTYKYQYTDTGGSPYSGWTNFTPTNVSGILYSPTLTSNGTADRIYQFQVTAVNGVCSASLSTIMSVSVYGLSGGTVSPASSYSIGVAAGTLTASSYIGSITKWQKQVGAGAWTDIPSSASATYSYSGVTTTTSFRALAQRGSCQEVPSVASLVTVEPAVISGYNYLAYGATDLLSTAPGFTTYQWIFNGTDIPGATLNYYYASTVGTYTVRVTKSPSAPYTTAGFEIQPIINNNSSVATSGSLVNNGFNAVASTTVILKEGVKTNSNLFALQPSEVSQTATYLDAFGRPFQQVAIGLSPSKNDIIQPVAYNANGFVEKQYLPYVAPRSGYNRFNAISDNSNTYTGSEQKSFYLGPDLSMFAGMSSKIAIDNNPYAANVYDASMTGRIREQGTFGAAWQPGTGHTTKSDFVGNVSNEVRVWKSDLTTNSYYAANMLAVGQSTDENGNRIKTYSDKLGRTILKKVEVASNSWLDTYYIYDVYNRLISQVPPKAMVVLGSGSSLDANATSVAELIFKYTYDERGRLIDKKVPGAASQYLVYDKADRLILVQDGNLRQSNKWGFIKYDFKDRPIVTGIITDATHTNLASMQSYVTSQLNVAAPYESRGTTLQGYTNTVYPIVAEADILTVNYFDDYDFNFNGTPDYSYTAQGLTGELTQASAAKLVTGSKVKIIGTTDYLITVKFYDTWRRPIQVVSNNHRRLTVDNIGTVVYDFAGKVLLSKNYVNAGTPVTINNRITYDHAGRPSIIYQQIDTDTEKQVASYTYNELGQLVQKTLDPAIVAQIVDYRFNIRGWLSSINNSSLTVDSQTNDGSNDYFGMELLYNTVDSGLGNTGAFNGNISAVKWKGVGSSGDTDRNAYVYTYDKADRLTNGQFKKYGTTAWDQEVNTLNEQISYDENGNITNLIRKQNQRGMSGLNITSTPQTIDDLTYTYTTGNQISKVEDASADNTGFINGTVNGTNEYTYNANGSLLLDKNKGIDSIKYNDLGKVARIKYTDGRVQTYKYAGSGTRLGVKTFLASGVIQSNNEYVGSLQYENAEVSSVPSAEGRLVRYGKTVADDNIAHFVSTSGSTAVNSAITAVTASGETYLKVLANVPSSLTGGVYMSSTAIQGGKKYLMKVKGYVTTASPIQPTLQIKPNTDASYTIATAAVLPIGASNEDWVSYEFTMPAAATSVTLAVLWNSPTALGTATEFYLNEIELKPVINDYQYSIKDHQGNTRVLFSSAPATPQVSTGDMENATNVSFPNYTSVFRSSNAIYNSTAAGTYSNLLNGGYNGKIGVAKSYKVYPGDKIKIEAKAKYTASASPGNGDVTALAAGLLSAFGLAPPGVGETGTMAAGLNTYGVAAAGASDPNSTNVMAYVNILVFDKKNNFLDAAYDMMDPGAAQVGVSPVVTPDAVMSEYTVKEEGYVYMYVSNESAKLYDVYFDDIKMTYTPGNVIQYNDYYPFGLRTAKSWDRSESGAIVNRNLYNSSSELNTTSNWYETMFREYDPVLGRMNGVDIMASKYGSLTPYNYALNNPVLYSDPSGAETPTKSNDNNTRDGKSINKDCYYAASAAGADYGNIYGDSGGYSGGSNGSTNGGSVDHIFPGSGGNWGDQARPMSATLGLMNTTGLSLFNPWGGTQLDSKTFTGEWQTFSMQLAQLILSKGVYTLQIQQNQGLQADVSENRTDFFYAGLEGTISAGAAIGGSIDGVGGAYVDAASLILFDFNVNNHTAGQMNYLHKTNNLTIKQEAGGSYYGGVNVKHTMETPAIGTGRWLNEKTEASISVLGLFSYTEYYNDNGTLDSSFFGLDMSGNAALVISGTASLKLGYKWYEGN